MAFPFKTGGDFYNCEAQRMRLHNLGANPTETATGLMYFNTGASNLGKHAVVHDGTNFKALAFVDEIATNTAFTELAERVQTIEKALGEDTADVIDTWEEIQNFLKDINANDANLMTMLDDKLSKSQGGTIDGNLDIGKNNANYTTQRYLRMWYGDGAKVYRGMLRVNAQNIQLSYYVPSSGLDYALTIGSNGLKYYDAGVERTLIHSGNIGEQSVDKATRIRTLVGSEVPDINTLSFADWSIRWYSSIPSSSPNLPSYSGHQNGLLVFPLHSAGTTAQMYMTAGNYLGFRGTTSGSWKQIAFTDSTVDNAKILVDANNAYMVYQTNAGHLYVGDNIYTRGDTHILGKNIRMRYGENASYGLILNSSGNVTIGAEDKAGTAFKMRVDGKTAISASYRSAYPALGSLSANSDFNVAYYDADGSQYGMYFSVNGQNGNSVIQTGRNDGNTTAYNLLLNPLGGNVLIGTTNEIKSGAKLQIKGDVYVDGNIIATKEVSAGGAGEEGESGDGGAEVIDAPIPSGVTTYTIPNTIGRSAVAVSLYEANVINGQTIWSLCLADIEVTNETITVTFGSATSVNHKLVAVG